MKPIRPTPCRNQHGISIIESLCAVAIVATAAGMAVPGFEQLRTRSALVGTAAQVDSAVQLARIEAVSRNRSVHLAIGTPAQGSCYVIHTGSRGACSCNATEAPVCLADAEVIHAVQIQPQQAAQVRSNTSSILFDPVRGTITPAATLRVVARDGSAVHQVVNILGRVRSCSPAGSVPGYKAC